MELEQQGENVDASQYTGGEGCSSDFGEEKRFPFRGGHAH
jgi:hypothetical protein